MSEDIKPAMADKGVTYAGSLLAKLGLDKNRPLLIAAGVTLLVIVLIASGYAIWRKIEGSKLITQAQLEASARQNQISLAAVRELELQLDELREKQSRLEDIVATLGDDQPLSNEDWALAEIEYLLIIATHRLFLEQDVDTALAAMEAADLRLRDLDNPRLIPVRKQLAADINQLRSVNVIDITGMAVYMADLIERFESFPLKGEITVTGDDGPGNATSGESEAGWRSIWNSIWSELKSLVVISRDTDAGQVLLLPHQEYFLYQNLRIELESARLSILRRDTDNLQTSIGMLKNWINRYFDTRHSGVANMLETLDHMASIELDPELPDISSSIESLRAYIRTSDLPEALPGRPRGSPSS